RDLVGALVRAVGCARRPRPAARRAALLRLLVRGESARRRVLMSRLPRTRRGQAERRGCVAARPANRCGITVEVATTPPAGAPRALASRRAGRQPPGARRII